MAEQLSKTFFVLIIFISTFGILLSVTPNEFLASPYEGDYIVQPYPENTWVGREISAWDETFIATSNTSIEINDYAYMNLSGIIEDDIRLNVLWTEDVDWDDPLYYYHRYPIVTIFGVNILWGSDRVHDVILGGWIYRKPIILDYRVEDAVNPEVARFEAYCDHYTYYMSVSYNSTKFSSLSQAWDGTVTYDPELYLFVGMGFESEWASLPTWMIIAKLLTFQAPDIHPMINGLIAIPLWIAVLYLAYHLLLRMLPFVGG
jgi:hypothetical protein